jgi:dimethylaniline monooxygenase (N-oxide forming)
MTPMLGTALLPPSKRVAVIGAGPAGLATLKELKDRDVDVVGFEAQPTIGGAFARQYRDLQLTSSNLITSFGSYSDGSEQRPVLWKRGEYLAYLKAYAQHFDLSRHIHFSTRVESLRRCPASGRWQLRAAPDPSACRRRPGDDAGGESGELPGREPLPAAGIEVTLDAVAICSGMTMRPVEPAWPGRERFRGRILHAASFWDQEQFAGKRVLVVGLGESGSDIALLIAPVARASAVSTRKGPGYVIPRCTADRPTDLDTNRCYHAIPRGLIAKPWVRYKTRVEDLFLGPHDDREVLRRAGEINRGRGFSPFHRFATKSTSFIEAMLYHGTEYRAEVARLEEDRAIFVDGTAFECDVIILCTGYSFHSPCLARTHPDLMSEAANPRRLYKRMIHPGIGASLAWIGFVRPGLGSVPVCAEMQARYFALLVSGERRLPPAAEMERDISTHARLDLEQFPEDAQRLLALTDYLRFMDGMAQQIGCRPPLRRLFFTAPRTWVKIVFGPLSAAQFRFAGPGAEPERSRRVLSRLPTMPWPVLAYEFMLLLGIKLLYLLTGRREWKPIGF